MSKTVRRKSELEEFLELDLTQADTHFNILGQHRVFVVYSNDSVVRM